LPIEQIRRGYADWRAFLAAGICAGRVGVVDWRDFLDGLFGGVTLRDWDSVSVEAGDEIAESYFCFFCWRFSLRLEDGVYGVNVIAESASLRSGVEVCGISGSSAGMWDAVGLATCARVVAFDFESDMAQAYFAITLSKRKQRKRSDYDYLMRVFVTNLLVLNILEMETLCCTMVPPQPQERVIVDW
jgi:hypothetical protein